MAVAAGTAFDLTVTAYDAWGNVATGYTGTITFTSSDPDLGLILPADFTFTTAMPPRSPIACVRIVFLPLPARIQAPNRRRGRRAGMPFR